ncbi:unnamed protein product [Prorocentrum cordatum]|uniref:Pentatricopeptide repeat-containing protein n=1 Tax=Prorocentrum cordatum TaxID=2364126 RepID=A0ABN9XMK3_9DINO|nr:unnamed protein product [Polarella glacialis]
MREGRTVAAGIGAAERDVGGETGERRHQLRGRDQRVREGRAVAAGFGVVQRDAGGEAGARRHQLQRWHQCMREGRAWQRALALLREIEEAKLEHDAISYGAGISACGTGGQWQRALALLSEMREAKLEPVVTSYNAGISACEVNGQWTQALDVLESMLACRVDPAAANNPDDGWYVHDLEAGGFKDVFKHIVLVALLQQMATDADPFTFIDMHAGSGVYDLSSEESRRCRMFERGVLRLSRVANHCGSGLIADYLTVTGLRCCTRTPTYGSHLGICLGPAGGSWCSWTRHTIPYSPTTRGTSSSSGACSRSRPLAAWPYGTRAWTTKRSQVCTVESRASLRVACSLPRCGSRARHREEMSSRDRGC